MSCKNQGPGPAEYGLPPLVGYPDHDYTKHRGAMYSFGIKGTLGDKQVGPGPHYTIDNVTRFGSDRRPAYSLGARTFIDCSNKGPGPSDYSPEACPLMKETRPPSFSMQSRNGVKSAYDGPGPMAYTLPSTLSNVAYSLTSRQATKVGDQSPGPAVYTLGTPDLVKSRAASYSLTSRQVSDKGQVGPGPAAYYSQYNGGKGPYKFSFGTKHSECSPPYLTEEDHAQ